MLPRGSMILGLAVWVALAAAKPSDVPTVGKPLEKPIPETPIVPTNSNGSAEAAATKIQLPPSPDAKNLPKLPIVPAEPVDKNVDLDGDGALSLPEVQYAAFLHHGLSSSVVEALFNQVDSNRDGYLNAAEFNAIRSLVLAKAENAALRYLQNVDTDRNQLLSLREAQLYILKEYGISNRDVERIWRLVVPTSSDEMDAVLFSKLRRRVRGMSIRLARQIMKTADINQDGHIDLREAQMIAFEQEGISAGDVVEMLASVDDNNDNELNAPEFADFERIVRARAVDTAKKALKVVDTDGSGTLTMDEAKKIAFDHYGFDEATLEPFFAQADENEDGQLDAVEFAGFRSVIRSRAVKNAQAAMSEFDKDNDGRVSSQEAEDKASADDDLEPKETLILFNVADQDRSNYLDRVELADFMRLLRLSAIKYVNEHFREFDSNLDKKVTADELSKVVWEKYRVKEDAVLEIFSASDVDKSGDLSAGEIVDFRHAIRKYTADRDARAQLESQNDKELALIQETNASTSEPQTNEETTVAAMAAATSKSETEVETSVESSGAEPADQTKKEEEQKPTTLSSILQTIKRMTTPDPEAATAATEAAAEPTETTTTATANTTQKKKTRLVKVRRMKSTTTTTTTTTEATTLPLGSDEELVEVEVEENEETPARA